MHVWYALDGWLDRRRALAGRAIGLVPTMGALHSGHASLVRRCRDENEVAVVTIFVNPPQFNDPKDLDRYPRTLEDDLALLESLGVDDVIVPPAAEVYPEGYWLRVETDGREQVMEAKHRPGFLRGVMTVVLKLLGMVRADRAYFGEKDYQQLQIVAGLAREFFIPTEIVPCATVREESGLAMSSRNTLLTPEGRERAAWIYRALTTAASPEEARALLAAQGFAVEYVEERWGRRCAAAYLEGIRLIDNTPLG